MEGLLILLGLVWIFGSFFGLIAFFSLSRLRRENGELRDAVARLAEIVERLPKSAAASETAQAQTPSATTVEPSTKIEPARPAVAEREAIEPVPLPELASPPPPPQPPRPSFEEQLTSRWLVWLGAATIALGGVFLVKFSIDYGLITPEMRVIFGFLFGAALVAAGEWLRRRGDTLKVEALRGSYVPPALTAAGLFIAFASTYAAFALYQMLSAPTSFIALAALVVVAIALSIWHGRGVALLGILGGFVTPLLVPSDQPSAWALFLYLGALVIALVVLIRFMNWHTLLWPVLVGIAFWIVAWVASLWTPGDIAAVGMFLVVTAAAFCAAFWDMPAKETVAGTTPPWPPLDLPPMLLVSLGVVFAGALFAFALDKYGDGTIAVLVALTALQLVIATRAPRLASLAATAALLVVATFYGWPSVSVAETLSPPVVPGPPDEVQSFLWTIALFGAAFAAVGFAKIWDGQRPLVWAWVSAATPLVLFALAYARVLNFGNDAAWAAFGLALAFLALVAVERCLKFRERPGLIEAAGAYSTAVISALGLSFAMVFEEAWLTVALSLLLPALAWTDRRLDIPAHRAIALVVGAIVIVRLILNPDVLNYETQMFGRASWVLYGYGIPALACGAAAWIFAQARRDQTVTVLEAAALLFAALTAFFGIRVLVAGSIAGGSIELFEASLHTLTWGVAAYGLERAAARSGNPVIGAGWKILLALAVGNLVIVHLVAENPIITRDPVGVLPLLNLLLLAYLAPAALACAFAIRFREREPWLEPLPASAVAWSACFLLVFAWMSLETRHAFRGPVLSAGIATDAEIYAYSVVWLLYAGGLLALAIRQASQALRWASLVVLFLTVGKVFLSDMSALTGLWRVASFVGLGLTLVGIGFLYQRYVFPHKPAPST